MKAPAPRSYEKTNSFEFTHICKRRTSPTDQVVRLRRCLSNVENKDAETLILCALDTPELLQIYITDLVAEEMATVPDSLLIDFALARHRYVFNPINYSLDDAPPYLQLELSSSCNYRCVFCFQSDPQLKGREGGHMGSMSLNTFSKALELTSGTVPFVSIASRGEPLLCKDIKSILPQLSGKYLSIKLNTNASKLTSELCHLILSSAITTLVFSVDAADPELYASLRRNGNLSRVLRNISEFNRIKNTYYPFSNLITRVSGVYVDERQSSQEMISLWSDYVDQITFVKYCAWGDTYAYPKNAEVKPCTELWRRMYIWFDGRVNPCEADYLSTLSVDSIENISNISEVWLGERYQDLRKLHLQGKRQEISPCDRCIIT